MWHDDDGGGGHSITRLSRCRHMYYIVCISHTQKQHSASMSLNDSSINTDASVLHTLAVINVTAAWLSFATWCIILIYEISQHCRKRAVVVHRTDNRIPGENTSMAVEANPTAHVNP